MGVETPAIHPSQMHLAQRRRCAHTWSRLLLLYCARTPGGGGRVSGLCVAGAIMSQRRARREGGGLTHRDEEVPSGRRRPGTSAAGSRPQARGQTLQSAGLGSARPSTAASSARISDIGERERPATTASGRRRREATLRTQTLHKSQVMQSLYKDPRAIAPTWLKVSASPWDTNGGYAPGMSLFDSQVSPDAPDFFRIPSVTTFNPRKNRPESIVQPKRPVRKLEDRFRGVDPAQPDFMQCTVLRDFAARHPDDYQQRLRPAYRKMYTDTQVFSQPKTVRCATPPLKDRLTKRVIA